MLRKLLKYDLKWVYKLILVFYILAFIFSLIGRLFALIDNSLVFNVISQICFGTAISMMVSSLINSLMRNWVRFVRNLYKDESYLTHTLPIPKKTIYLSKALTSIISIFTSVIVILLCLFICYYSKENMEILKSVLEIAAQTYNTTVIKLLLLISLVIFLEIIFIVFIGYVGIIIGHRSNKNKMVKSVIAAIVLYFTTQGITLISIFIYGLFNPDIMNLINTTKVVSVGSIKNLMFVAIILYTMFNLFYYFLGRKILEKGVNVD